MQAALMQLAHVVDPNTARVLVYAANIINLVKRGSVRVAAPAPPAL